MKLRSFLPYLLIALGVALAASFLASSWPDGLERVAHWLGFARRANPAPLLQAPLPDYSVPAWGETPISTIFAGLLGTLICFALSFLFFFYRKK